MSKTKEELEIKAKELDSLLKEKQARIEKLEKEIRGIYSDIDIIRSEYRELIYPPKFDKDGYASAYDYQPVLNKEVEVITRAGNTEQGIASKFDYVQPVVGSEPSVASRWKYI